MNDAPQTPEQIEEAIAMCHHRMALLQTEIANARKRQNGINQAIESRERTVSRLRAQLETLEASTPQLVHG
jgi:chromosome segregation ATPase